MLRFTPPNRVRESTAIALGIPIKAAKTHGKRVDYEYERYGTASIFMFAEPLAGYRQATARPQRTKVDWALEVGHLLDTRYADCEWITHYSVLR